MLYWCIPEGMEFLASSESKTVTFEAESTQAAMKKAAELLLQTDWERKHGNFALVPKPTSKEEWIERHRKVACGNAEYLESFGYTPAFYKTLEAALKEGVRLAEEPPPPPTE